MSTYPSPNIYCLPYSPKIYVLPHYLDSIMHCVQLRQTLVNPLLFHFVLAIGGVLFFLLRHTAAITGFWCSMESNGLLVGDYSLFLFTINQLFEYNWLMFILILFSLWDLILKSQVVWLFWMISNITGVSSLEEFLLFFNICNTTCPIIRNTRYANSSIS